MCLPYTGIGYKEQTKGGKMAYLYSKNKDTLLLRLKKIEGQVRGVQRMLKEDRYCIEILQQISALSAALNQVALSILQDHIQGCVTKAIKEQKGEEAIKELMDVLKGRSFTNITNFAKQMAGEIDG